MIAWQAPLVKNDQGSFLRSPVRFAQAEQQRHEPWSPRMLGTHEFEDWVDENYPNLNSDPLAQKQGIGVYPTMLRGDDMCSAGSSYLLLGCLSPGTELVEGADDNESKRARDFAQMTFDKMQGTLTQMLLGILSAPLIGYSLGEIVWGDVITEGEWKVKQPIGQLQQKNQAYIDFKNNSAGQVEKDGVWQRNYSRINQVATTADAAYTKHLLEDVVYWPYWPMNDDAYGSPLLKAAYPHYVAKHFTMKKWASFLERYGHPIVTGKVPPKTPKAVKDTYKDMLKHLWSNMVGIIYNNFETELLTPDFKSTDSFEKMLGFNNRSIARSLLLPATVMEQGTFGSLAMSREQGSEGQFVWIMKHMSGEALSVVNEQFLRNNHEHNFDSRIPQPKLKMLPYSKDDLKIRAEVLVMLHEKLGVALSAAAINEEFSVDEPINDEDILKAAKAAAPAGPLALPGIGQLGPYPPNTTVPQLPPEAPKEVQDDFRKEVTKMAIARARGEKMGTTTYSAAPPAQLQDQVPFEETQLAQEMAGEVWGGLSAMEIENIADKAQAQAKKGNGVPLLK